MVFFILLIQNLCSCSLVVRDFLEDLLGNSPPPPLGWVISWWGVIFLVVGGRLDECSINRRCHGTIAFGH